jgi:hypothetical protein
MLSELDSRHPINFIKTAAPNKIMSKIYKLWLLISFSDLE